MDYSQTINESLLRAMPADAYMDATQVAFFRLRLEGMRSEAEARLAAMQPLTSTDESPLAASDDNDRASLHEQQEAAHKERERLVIYLREVGAALQRLEAGEYGYCLDTGDEIGLERLLALPTASYSIEAQQLREQRTRQRIA